MADQPAGSVLDALGVTLDLEPSQQIVAAVVIGKVVDFDSDDPRPALILGTSNGLDWIDQRGLIYTAAEVMQSEGTSQAD